MDLLLPWCETAALFLGAAIAALYASRGSNLARNCLVAAALASWGAYRVFGPQ